MYKNEQRSLAIDALKGFAITAIALYHLGGGVTPYGYLGVDIFLVISGYFLIKRLNEQIPTKEFRYGNFIFNRLVRFWPLVLFVSVITLLLGYFLMLPDDYENLAESVVASSLFANNILQCITTRNYWDVVMRYKPLMHLWYIGLLMQVYVILPLIYIYLCKFLGKSQKSMLIVTAGLTIISFLLYLSPFFSDASKFYYPPFRLFEIMAGGLLAFIQIDSLRKSFKQILLTGVTITLLLLLCSRTGIKPSQAMLLGTAIMTLIFLNYNDNDLSSSSSILKVLKSFSIVGKGSYSIYIWHQVIVAFLFYSVFQRVNAMSVIVFAVLTSILSWSTYKFIELPLQKIKGSKAVIVVISCLITSILACSFSLKIYKNAGVVRDVPELNISKDNVHRHMHAEYCDIPYSWDRDFAEDNRIKVLVVGNSFGRDFANILNEWDQGKLCLDISYKYYSAGVMEKLVARIEKADFVFYAVSGAKIPEDIVPSVPSSKLYIIGNKKYGESNGIIYAKRGSADYFSQTVELPEKLLAQNIELAKIYKNHYIDMMGIVMVDDKHAKVFTDDNKYISQDCSHLTRAGAQYYSRILELEKLFLN